MVNIQTRITVLGLSREDRRQMRFHSFRSVSHFTQTFSNSKSVRSDHLATFSVSLESPCYKIAFAWPELYTVSQCRLITYVLKLIAGQSGIPVFVKLLSYPYLRLEIKHIRQLFHVNRLRIKKWVMYDKQCCYFTWPINALTMRVWLTKLRAAR